MPSRSRQRFALETSSCGSRTTITGRRSHRPGPCRPPDKTAWSLIASHGVAGELGSLQPRIDLVCDDSPQRGRRGVDRGDFHGCQLMAGFDEGLEREHAIRKKRVSKSSSVISRPIRTSTLGCATLTAFRDGREAIATPAPVWERTTPVSG